MKNISRVCTLLVVLISVALTGCSAPTQEDDIKLLGDRGLKVLKSFPHEAPHPTLFHVQVGKCPPVYVYKKDGRFYIPEDPFLKSTAAEIMDPTLDGLRKIKAYEPCFS